MPPSLHDALRDAAPQPARPLTTAAVVTLATSRRRRRRRVEICGCLALALTLIAAASFAVTHQESHGDVAIVETATSTTVGAPEPTLAPYSDAPTVSCNPGSEENAFPATALSGPVGAEQADTPAAAALRAAFADPTLGSTLRGLSSWRLLAQTSTRASFAAGDDLTRYEVTVEVRDGAWKFSSSGGCLPVVIEPGLYTAHILPGPGFPLDPSATKVNLNVDMPRCAGGQQVSPDRIVGPQIQYQSDKVIITYAVKPDPSLPPDTLYTCPSHPPTPVTAELSEPLGTRTIYDGSIFPAQRMIGG